MAEQRIVWSGKGIIVSVECCAEESELATVQQAELLHVGQSVKISAEQIWMKFGIVRLSQRFSRGSSTLHEAQIVHLSVFCVIQLNVKVFVHDVKCGSHYEL
jgi:hypothetical protein